jgi:hypothetical protein
MENDQVDNQSALVPMATSQLLQTLLLGLVVGLVVWGLAFVLDAYILRAILCQGDQTMGCSVGNYAEASAAILATGLGLFGLMRLRVFRPLLVALATLVALWGVIAITSGMQWYMIGLSIALLYAISYAFFAWIARIRSFVIVLIVLVVIIAAVRFIFNS